MYVHCDRFFYSKKEMCYEAVYENGTDFYYLQHFHNRMKVYDMNGRVTDAAPDSFYLAPPNIPMYFCSYEPSYMHSLIIFKADPDFMQKLDLPYMTPFLVPNTSETDKWFMDMENLHISDLPVRQEAEDACAVRILTFLHEQTHMQTKKPVSLESDELQRARLVIFGNLGRDWSSESMAECAHMSVRNFYRKYKEHFGKSPKEDLADFRFDVSKKLMKSGYPFSFILRSCGFKSLAHFSSFFKKKSGMSPTEYMHRLSSEQEITPFVFDPSIYTNYYDKDDKKTELQ